MHPGPCILVVVTDRGLLGAIFFVALASPRRSEGNESHIENSHEQDQDKSIGTGRSHFGANRILTDTGTELVDLGTLQSVSCICQGCLHRTQLSFKDSDSDEESIHIVSWSTLTDDERNYRPTDEKTLH